MRKLAHVAPFAFPSNVILISSVAHRPLLVLFLSVGPSKLPEVGKGLGKTFKSFQTAAKVSLS